MQVLIVEDNAELAASIAEFLELQGAQCDFAYNGASGLKMATELKFDVILLDMMLPKMDGINVCQEMRLRGCTLPVLMLTAIDTETDQLAGFRAGVDDYVVKPCPMPLLWARLEALYRRTRKTSSLLKVGPLELDRGTCRVVRSGKEISLTPTEWKILEFLMLQSPNIVSRIDIEDYIWPDQDSDPGKLNVHLHGLRKAVDKPFDYPLILTRTGLGLSIEDTSGK
ncbi:two-component system response regulator [Hahella sp. CCB-MM4]|uniref:response regulator transcription factor n=1 Tax=Hahella sp. (strain CCB-MM4) TaxID=1926491 RepID=UPI000B9C13A5|nr:response regulator transcription factor [Hahella sp. CCB-MM4]OZG69751.1 two-component system response regulator [Hahella sp. CCB-MM4]